MDVHVLVGVDMVERQPGGCIGGELGLDLAGELAAHRRLEEIGEAGAHLVVSEAPVRADQVGNLIGRQDRRAVDQDHMQADTEIRQAPGAFDGAISAPGDVDWFAFDGVKDQSFEVRVWARELGSPLDSVLVVHGPDGAQLASVDDAVGPDSLARVKLPARAT